MLPEVWRGQVNIGLDPLRRSYLPEAGGDVASSSLPAAATAVDPLAGFARRLDRVARGGWRTLPPEVGREIAADCRGLDQCMLPTGAVILRWLHRIANDRPRDFSGRLRPVDAGAAAEVWIAASRYREGVQRSVLRGLWS